MAASDVSIRRVIVNPPGLDVENEVVFLHNGGEEDVDLTGWTLSDALSHPGPVFTFTFPDFTLLSGSDVAIHTSGGTNDGQHLFWDKDTAVWNNAGDRATLADAGGEEVDSVTWSGQPQQGRVIDTSEIAQDIAGLDTVGGVADPTAPVEWTIQSNGAEMFWQEFGETGAAFHAGFHDSLPPGAPAPEDKIIRVTHSIYRKYLDLGGPQAMGRPLTARQDVTVSDAGREAHRQEFEGGTIYRSPETGAHLVKGAIRAKWLSPEAGGPSGLMGLPVSDERPDSSGVIFSDFERGSIWFTPAGGAEVLIGIVIEFVGFRCFGEQQGLGSDEVYFEVDVAPTNPPVDAPRAIDDGIWVTVLPGDGRPVYENVDSAETHPDTHPVFIGRAAPLRVKTHLFEFDGGDPNLFRNEIKTAVAAAGAVTAAFVPAASAVALNPEVQATVTSIINGIAGTGDDIIGSGEFGFGSRKQILEKLHTPPQEEFGLLVQERIFLTDGDASYNAYFTVRRWEPDS